MREKKKRVERGEGREWLGSERGGKKGGSGREGRVALVLMEEEEVGRGRRRVSRLLMVVMG